MTKELVKWLGDFPGADQIQMNPINVGDIAEIYAQLDAPELFGPEVPKEVISNDDIAHNHFWFMKDGERIAVVVLT